MNNITILTGFLSDKGLFIPLEHIILFAVVTTSCLLLNKCKSGLLLVCCFIIYWGFIANSTYFLKILDHTGWGLFVYALFGLSLIVSIFISILHEA